MKPYWMQMTTGLLLGVVWLAAGCGRNEGERTNAPDTYQSSPQSPGGSQSESIPSDPSQGTEQKQPDETKEQKPAEKVK